MKLTKYIHENNKQLQLLTLFLVFTVKTFACWSPTYTPGEYWTFYAVNYKPTAPTITEQNINEWKKHTAGKAAYDDIYAVVYKYSLETMERIGSKSFTKRDTLYKNSFVKYLIDKKDKEAIQYLILAKKCEARRARRNDPWWYPTKEDLKFTDLREVLDEALSYKGKKLKNRYYLQAIRAAYTMGEHELCLKLWHNHIKRQPATSVRTLCEDYIGGIYFQKGDYKKAIQHYANTMQRTDSFWWCVNNMTKENSDIERIKILYQYCPSSPELAQMVQDICREAEDKANPKIFPPDNYYKWYKNFAKNSYNDYLNNRKRYIALRDFALQVASENRSDNPAMWQYAASFLTMLDGNSPLALQYIVEAEQMKCPASLKDNIKILHLMLDAMTGNYDEAFEERILPQLQWLDDKIKNNITKEIKNQYWDGWMFDNGSFYYYNDMMRKITLSIMAPRYIKKGEPVKALMLAGMASERFRTVINLRNYTKENFKMKTGGDNIDFYTDIFRAMDAAAVEDVIAYRDVLQQGGNTDFERFLAARCYRNINYFNELIGTKYMREEQFDKAIAYLSEVPAKYNTQLNIYPYFHYDPLSEPYLGQKHIKPTPNYKLNFAKRMLALQNKMDTTQNKQKKIQATYQYAVGLMRATNDCWALQFYERGHYDCNSGLSVKHNLKMEANCQKLFKQVLASSRDKELKAKCLAAQIWISGDDSSEWKEIGNGRWGRVNKPNSVFVRIYNKLSNPQYANTKISQQLFSECDVFLSYKKRNEKTRSVK